MSYIIFILIALIGLFLILFLIFGQKGMLFFSFLILLLGVLFLMYFWQRGLHLLGIFSFLLLLSIFFSAILESVYPIIIFLGQLILVGLIYAISQGQWFIALLFVVFLLILGRLKET